MIAVWPKRKYRLDILRRWAGMLPCVCIVLLLPGSRIAAEQRDERLSKILTDWDRRRDRVGVVRYQISGEQTIPKGSTLDPDTEQPNQPPRPKQDVKVRKKVMLLLDFVNNRHRLENDCESFNRDLPESRAVRRDVDASLFDGTYLKSLNPWDESKKTPKPSRADLASLKGYLGNYSGFNHLTYPLFLGHAIFGRGIPGGGDYYPGHLKPKPDAKYWIVDTEREVEGRLCLVLRVNAKAGAFDIWVDTTRESAVIRFVELIQGLRRADLHIDYQETPKGWLPKQWKWSRFYYHVDGRLESMEEMFVDKLTLEPPLVEADFTFEEKQGMLILENVQAPPAVPHGPTRITERQWFRIDASGKRTEVPKDKAPESGSPFWWGMALALPAVAFALLLYTRFRKGKPPG